MDTLIDTRSHRKNLLVEISSARSNHHERAVSAPIEWPVLQATEGSGAPDWSGTMQGRGRRSVSVGAGELLLSNSSYVSSFSARKSPVHGSSGGIELAQSWVPDPLALQCYRCHDNFGFLWGKRKHHCRVCGNVFCHSCSNKQIDLLNTRKNVKVRICLDCHNKVNEEGCSLSSLETSFETNNDGNGSKMDLMSGESVLQFLNDIKFEDSVGSISVTDFRIVFIGTQSKLKVEIPLMTIERVEVGLDYAMDAGRIRVFCKNFRFVILSVTNLVKNQRFSEFHHLEQQLLRSAFPSTCLSLNERFFSVGRSIKAKLHPEFSNCCLSGHYNHLRELNQMIGSSTKWRISTANETFEMCPTYPKFIAVPASVTDEELKEAAMFRTRGRIPALSWLVDGNICLCRSSQPKVGVLNQRSTFDEKLVQEIAASAGLLIIDARPVVNAAVNRVTKHGGYEEPSNYSREKTALKGVSLEFMNVPNIKTVQHSFHSVKKLVGADLKSEGQVEMDFEFKWQQRFSETSWIELQSVILKAVVRVISAMRVEKRSVLVHCSDGWDRTSQIVSLVQLLMNPLCRTIQGFANLVEKEWLSMGHPFMTRCGTNTDALITSKSSVKLNDKHVSPIFIQFLEITWQILIQYPGYFQFNEQLLVELADKTYDCSHGTFMVDCRKQQVENRMPLRSTCVWSEFIENATKYTNQNYQASCKIIIPQYSTKKLQLWRSYILRYDTTCA